MKMRSRVRCGEWGECAASRTSASSTDEADGGEGANVVEVDAAGGARKKDRIYG